MYKNAINRPTFLGLAGSLLSSINRPYAVQTEISILENLLNCTVDTTSDSHLIVKFGARPKECLLEFKEFLPDEESENLISRVIISLLLLVLLYPFYSLNEWCIVLNVFGL